MKIDNVETYIKTFPIGIQKILRQIRTIIKESAPESDETISYAMPTYKINGKPLVYFAAFEKHIGLYAIPSAQLKFKKELSKYKQGKGSVQFPLHQPIPFKLIERIVKFKIKENKTVKKYT
jgi:uncharacterized protein YdhG (YjbR/CyaY superfamily)